MAQQPIHASNRLTWIDYAKGITIMLVLYRHVFEGLKNAGLEVSNYVGLEHANIIFFSFRMPLFFIVSGVFIGSSLQKRGLGAFLSTKAKTILYPYFIWASLQIGLQIVFSKYVNSDRTVRDFLYLFYQPREIEQFWYLYALFNVTVIYAVVRDRKWLNHWQQIVLGVILFYISAYTFQEPHKTDTGFVGDILHYYLFFAIGDAISHIIMDRKRFAIYESWKLCGYLLIPFVVSQGYFLYANLDHADMKYLYVEFYQPFLYIIIALTGCAFTVSIAFILQRTNRLKWIQVLGKHSLYIYVAHVMVLASVRIVMTKILHINNVPVLLICGIASGLIIPVLLYKLAIRLNCTWLYSLEKSPLRIAT